MKFTGCSRAGRVAVFGAGDYKLDIIIGQGPSAAHAYAGGEAVYVCGCDHAGGLISAPLRSRWIVLRLSFNTPGICVQVELR